MNGARPVLVSDDPELIDEVLRLAAANGVEVHLCADAEAARLRWQVAPLVIVGADAAPAVAAASPGRRRDLVLVGRAPTDADWQHAVALGAEHVVALPDGERWLIDRLADCAEGISRDGRVLAVVGSGGGAGASTFAATLALAAASAGQRVLLLDGDPVGGGLDLVLGIEEAVGVRWPDLLEVRGRLTAAALDQALPHISGVATLSWSRSGVRTVPLDVVTSVVDAAVRGYDLVVADVPRRPDAAGDLLLSRADHVLVVVPNHVRGTAAAAQVVSELSGRSTAIDVVLRMDPRGLHEDAVAAVLDVPVLETVPFIGSIVQRADQGEPPSLRDAYGRACAQVVRRLAPTMRRAA